MNAYKIVPSKDLTLNKGKLYSILITIWFLFGLGFAFQLGKVWVGNLLLLFFVGFILMSLFLLLYRFKDKQKGITKENHIKMIDAFENGKVNSMADLEYLTGLKREVIVMLITLYWENGWIISTSDISLDDFSEQLEEFINN